MIDGRSSSEPGGKFSWKSKAASKRKEWIAEERFDLFEGTHDGYERSSDPATHSRSVLFIKGDYWIMRDLVETAGDHDYSLNFHFDHGVKTAIGGGGAWIGGDDHRLFTFGDNGSWEQKESWISKAHGNRVNAPFLRFVSKGAGTQEFFTFIMPADFGRAPEVREIPLAFGRAFVIKYAGYTDLFVFNDEGGQLIDNGIFESDHKYSWARLSDGESVPEEFILIDGSRLRVNGNAVLGEPGAGYAAIRRLGNAVNIKTQKGRRTATLGFVDRRKGDRREAGSDRRHHPAK